MTSKQMIIKKTRLFEGIKLLLYIGILFIFIIFSQEIKQNAISGARLALLNILPTLFPFFVISDLWIATVKISPDSKISKLFHRVFHISSNGITPFILGLLFGFPCGVKAASNLYNNGNLTKDETERLICYVNNPSAAYVISGIGLGLFKSIKIGLILYLSVIISAIIIGLFLRKKMCNCTEAYDNSRQSFNFVNSIKSAGSSSFNILCYIVFFSSVCGIIKLFATNSLIFCVISSLLEISNTINYIACNSGMQNIVRMFLVGFSLGFSGLSVHFQAFSFLPKEILKSKYITYKLLQGILCGIFISLFYLCI